MEFLSQETMSIKEKLGILSDAAKYDVACTSSGVDRTGNGRDMGSALPQFQCRRQMYFTVEDSDDQ